MSKNENIRLILDLVDGAHADNERADRQGVSEKLLRIEAELRSLLPTQTLTPEEAVKDSRHLISERLNTELLNRVKEAQRLRG